MKPGVTLLVVDPSDSVRKVVELSSREFADRFLEAKSVAGAMEKMDEQVNVVLTELHLPDGTGDEVLAAAKTRYPSCVVLAVTAEDDVGRAVELVNRGALSVVSKPFTRASLQDAIRRAIRQHDILVENESAQEMKKRYHQELEGRVDEQTRIISSLLEFSNELNTMTNVSLAVGLISSVMKSALGCERIAILLREEESEKFSPVNGGAARDIFGRSLTPVESPLLSEVVRTGSIVLAEEADGVPVSAGTTESTSLVSVPLMANPEGVAHGEVFGVINVMEKLEARSFDEADLRIIRSIADVSSIAIANIRNKQRLEASYFDTVGALALALEAKDVYTHGHSQRVTNMCMVVADVMKFENQQLDQIMFAGMLHDVGKIGVPESILLKKGPLTSTEFENIKRHPAEGERMLKHISFLDEASSIIRQHHERWDGNGYPDRLRGEEISLSARIMAIADSYDAMTTDRSYRKRLQPRQVLDELSKGKGTQFDPDCLDLFVEHVAESPSIPSH